MIVFISCTAKKKHYQCKAKEMYSESTWFRHAFRYAKYITGGVETYISSRQNMDFWNPIKS